ncbi:DUF2752 domain-containing protein [Nocardioides pacificus]
MTTAGVRPEPGGNLRTEPPLPRRSRRMVAPVATAAVVGALTFALHLRDPNQQGSWGVCPFSWGTGLDCPGCGALRAVHALTDLDLVAAASSNLVLVVCAPLLVALWAGWARQQWRGTTDRLVGSQTRLRIGVVVMVALLVFALLRNLPGLEWLAS